MTSESHHQRAPSQTYPGLSRESATDELLWHLPGELEAAHRQEIHRLAVAVTYVSWVRNSNHLPEMTSIEFDDTCNMSVPVYFLGALP
jgi:hypothetical protein